MPAWCWSDGRKRRMPTPPFSKTFAVELVMIQECARTVLGRGESEGLGRSRAGSQRPTLPYSALLCPALAWAKHLKDVVEDDEGHQAEQSQNAGQCKPHL